MKLPDRYWTVCIMWRDGTVTFSETPYESALLAVFAADDMMHSLGFEEFAIFQCTRHRGEAWMSENVTEDVLAEINAKRDYYAHILPTREERIERDREGRQADLDAAEHVKMERMAL